MLLMQRLLKKQGSLVKIIPSKIMLLDWEGQETAWREIIVQYLNLIAERTLKH
jgi:hypothetical protein